MRNASKKVVLAGGSGFLGQTLTTWFAQRNWQVVILSRRARADSANVRTVVWDGRTLGDWTAELDGATALVNLAGRSVNCRYHRRNRDMILHSRLDSTRVLGAALARCSTSPPVWLNSSTATIYRHSLDRPMDEITGEIAGTPAAKDLFSIEVATRWEQALMDCPAPATRRVALRTAMVFSRMSGTVYPMLRRLARLGLGGPMAGGRQYVSWLHQDDFCRAIEWLIDHDALAGPVNLAAPHPLTNAELMREIRRAVGRKLGLPATRWMLEIGAVLLRTETELIIKSRRVVPGRLTTAGFEFLFPTIQGCLANLERRSSAEPTCDRPVETVMVPRDRVALSASAHQPATG